MIGGVSVLILSLLGLIPFAIGGFMNFFMLSHTEILPPYALIGIVTLIVWALIAFIAKPFAKDTKKLLFAFNLPAFAVLVLLCVQELVFKSYWQNPLGLWTQLYYLPLINISARLTMWSSRLFVVYCAAFLLLLAASFLGCKLRKN